MLYHYRRISILMIFLFLAGIQTSTYSKSINQYIGIIKDIRGSKEIIVSLVSAEYAEKIHIGDKLYILTTNGSKSIIVSFPMMSHLKCSMSPDTAKYLKQGMKVYIFDPENNKSIETSYSPRYKIKAESCTFQMTYLKGGKFTASTNDNQIDIVDAPYLISEGEIYFELWKMIYDWAKHNNYYFENSGKAGSTGEGSPLEPVTSISWFDAIVWCNALTEFYNEKNPSLKIECVYYSDENYSVIIRNSDPQKISDYPFIKPGTKGFRLPSNKEWEFAAKFISDLNKDGNILNKNEFYPGNFASGAKTDVEITGASQNVAWYRNNSGGKTHEIKTKSPNAAGIYDMSGNVWEWCFDASNTPGEMRAAHGGAWDSPEYYLQIGLSFDVRAKSAQNNIGFRIACDDK